MPRDVGLARTLIAVNTASGKRLPLTFIYNASDPLFVTLRFTTDAVWTFSRDVLADGVHGHAGHGDVRVARVSDDEVHITLNNGQTFAVLAFERPYLVRALERTFALVPRGTEPVDVEGFIAKLGGAE